MKTRCSSLDADILQKTKQRDHQYYQTKIGKTEGDDDYEESGGEEEANEGLCKKCGQVIDQDQDVLLFVRYCPKYCLDQDENKFAEIKYNSKPPKKTVI